MSSPPLRPIGPVQLSPRQRRIADWLATQVGPELAGFFFDAVGLLAERGRWRTTPHLVAHALREIESAVRWVLQPAAGTRPPATAVASSEKANSRKASSAGKESADKHKAVVQSILADLGLAAEDAVSGFWLDMTQQNGQWNLATWAHREALEVRRINAAFLELVDRFEQVLDAVMERFESRYDQVFQRLDELLLISTPTRADAKTLRQRVPQTAVVRGYFFQRAAAGWVVPLREESFFGAPPEPLIDEDAGTVQLPWWPASDYLARMAAAVPEEVVAATLEIPPTDNSRVHFDIVRVALAVPAPLSATLLDKVIEGLASKVGVLQSMEVGSLIAHLSRGGAAQEALRLASALLGRVPTPRPMTTTDAYEYGFILRTGMPPLVDSVGLPALSLLVTALAEVIRLDVEGRPTPDGYDGSPIWRPNLEGQEARAESELRHALVNAVRDSADALVAESDAVLPGVIAEFESQPWLILRRLALRLLALHASSACDLVAAHLTDQAIIRNRNLDGEYLRLAHDGAGCLDAGHLRTLLNLIDQGPSPSTSAGDDAVANQAIAEELAARWQRNRLGAIRAVLPTERAARLAALEAEYGEARDPAAPALDVHGTWCELPEGPVTAGELAAMSAEALVEFLQSWTPPADDPRPLSPASLRGALSSAIQAEAGRWSGEATRLIGLPPVYVAAAVNGFVQAAQGGTALNWVGIVQLGEWINQQAVAELASSGHESDRDWQQTRTDLLYLLLIGLNATPSPMTSDLDAQVWTIIASSCEDPAPTAQDDANDEIRGDRDLRLLAYNSARPQGIRVAITYGRRLRQREDKADLTSLLALLDEYLDPAKETSPAVRSVYGELFGQLAWMDAAWAEARVATIFPLAATQKRMFDAAWLAYLLSSIPNERTWRLLGHVYEHAVDSVATGSGQPDDEQVPALGRHLLNLLWNGWIDLDSRGGLLRRYYSGVAPKDAHDFLGELGHGLRRDGEIDSALIDRLIRLWDFRVQAVRDGSDSTELTAFGWWFASGRFDPDWALAQMLTTLRLAGAVEAEGDVLLQLAALARSHLQPALSVLDRWIRTEPPSWRLTPHLDTIRQLISAGSGGDSVARATSSSLISVLLRDYAVDLRDPPAATGTVNTTV